MPRFHARRDESLSHPSPRPAVSPPGPFLGRCIRVFTDPVAWRLFLRRWAISIASLVGGLLVLFVFRRGVPHVGWIVGYLVVLWLLFTVLVQARQRLLARGRRLVLVAGEYTIQTLYHGLLLFVLPGYFASTTFDGITLPFFVVLAGAALVTTIDPWFGALIQPYPWAGWVFFAFSIFAGLNVALPLVGVPPAGALLGSAALAGLALTPAFVERVGAWSGAFRLAGLSAAFATGVAWLGLPAIPPAPLHLMRPTIARAVVDLEPVDPVGPRVSAGAVVAAWGGLVAYTPVSAPAGLRQPIIHRWQHEGRVVTTVRLSTPVLGGRAAGFRTYSRKSDFPADPRGRWSVDVVTASGQLIGRLRFTVVP
ncbi:MAG: DUF2914 domain-containing protein [Candidatus Rokubacteria bacterium]|nr:DUF2914 domain-containing protein [Candidatus Rokubacteria bacterium]